MNYALLGWGQGRPTTSQKAGYAPVILNIIIFLVKNGTINIIIW